MTQTPIVTPTVTRTPTQSTPASTVPQNWVIGDGTPKNCTVSALAAAVTAGGSITFDCGPDPVTLAGGPYTVNGNLRIDGAGQITLDGQNAHRLFLVNGDADLALVNLTLTNGRTSASGGAIFNQGVLTLDTVTIRDSQANGSDSAGGAIYNQDGTLYVQGSTLLGNSAQAEGGGISSALGTTTIYNSLIEGNEADSIGGILSTGALFVRNSTVVDNRARIKVGGGIGVRDGTALIEGSLIQGNWGASGGGGLFIGQNHSATVTVRDSRILDNEADQSFAGSLGGGIYSGAILTLERVTVDGNRSYSAGGLYQTGNLGTLVVRQSSISRNRAVHVGGGLLLTGRIGQELTNTTISGNQAASWAGGIYAVDFPVLLSFSTVYNNSAPTGANLYNVRTKFTLSHAIVGAPTGGGLNCGAESTGTPFFSDGRNIASDGSCGLTHATDQNNVNPLLGPLMENGGGMESHLPLAGSSAIDSGTKTDCPVEDQRGFMRPNGLSCDTGAVEVGASPPVSPSDPPLLPLSEPVAIDYIWPGQFNLPVVQFPLPDAANLPAGVDPSLLGKHRIDLTICLYRYDMAGDSNPNRDPYEEIIDRFADGIYEMSNGAHVLRWVTMIYGCNPGVSQNMTGTQAIVTADTQSSFTADIIWRKQLWPAVERVSSWGVPGSHLFFADNLSSSTPPMNALSSVNWANAGYTLAHEWGHYMYGLGDEYPNATVPCDADRPYQGPCGDDIAAVPSVMSCQFRATGITCGDWSETVASGLAWLNFSAPVNRTSSNANFRVYQADGWTTLARPNTDDPPDIYSKRIVPLRFFFQELRKVAPASNQLPRIDLVTDPRDPDFGISRRALTVIWRRQGETAGGGNGIPQLEPNVLPFHHCLACPENLFLRNEFNYPNPAEFNLNLTREYPVADMQIVAEIIAPDKSKQIVTLPAGTDGNTLAQLPYRMGGPHQVTFTFTNPNLQARFTNAGFTYAPAMSGDLDEPVIDEAVGVPFTITLSTAFTVTNFQTDDHADIPSGATLLPADNEAVPGRMDRTGDVDMFSVPVGVQGNLVIRVIDLSLGMKPRLVVRNAAGALLFDGTLSTGGAPYLFVMLSPLPGEQLFAAVSDAANGVGGSYRISAGNPLSTWTERPDRNIFLPLVVRE